VIVGPSTFSGIVPELGVADMSPSVRKPCERIQSRMTILSDGKIVACENDILGRHPVGDAASDRIEDVWTNQMGTLRASHQKGTSLPVLCSNCREWNRP
jgi:radical SAM protein with 4Fe4S-binding SPASM domain